MSDQLLEKFQAGLRKIERRNQEVVETPWILIAGEPGVGKTSLLLAGGLGTLENLEFENLGAQPTEGMDWWFGREAMVLDTSGEWLISQAAPPPSWQTLFKSWKTTRPGTALNAAILCVSADSFLQGTEDTGIRDSARRLAAMANTLRSGLGHGFPIVLAITKCDKIPGFVEWFSPEDKIEGEFPGWSAQGLAPNQVPVGTIQASLEGLHHQLLAKRIPFLGMGAFQPFLNPQERDRWFDFPERLGTSLSGVRAFISTFYAELSGDDKPGISGIYFTSARPQGPEQHVTRLPLFCQSCFRAHLLPLARAFRRPAETAPHPPGGHWPCPSPASPC